MQSVLFICTANYYRSRFCEHLFNHLANQQNLNWTATSRAVAFELGTGNVGPISKYALEGLQIRGVALPDQIRVPQQLTEADLQSADVIIVLDEDEHRPYMNMKFPDWADKVTYWHIGGSACGDKRGSFGGSRTGYPEADPEVAQAREVGRDGARSAAPKFTPARSV